MGGLLGTILAKIFTGLLQTFLQRHDFRQRVLAEVKGSSLEALLRAKEWEIAASQHSTGGGNLRVQSDSERLESFKADPTDSNDATPKR